MRTFHRWCFLVPSLSLAVFLTLAGVGEAVFAEDEPDQPPKDAQLTEGEPDAKPAPEQDLEQAVAEVRGRRVNVRVGPRVDNAAVMQVDAGETLVIVERVPGWFGVRIPTGMPAVISAKYVEDEGPETVRVTGSRVNLRVHVPEVGRPEPGVFRDRVVRGDVLPVLRKEGDWVWILAPETVRAYVHVKYVKELGSLEEHEGRLVAARGKRAAQTELMAKARRKEVQVVDSATLANVMGAAQEKLYRLRLRGGWDRTPVVAIADALDEAVRNAGAANPRTLRLARALRDDLEAEIEVRMARKDAEVARLRGLMTEPEKPLAAKAAAVTCKGVIRWESAPKWKNGGFYVMWIGNQPKYVLRLTTGGPLPYPDLKGNAVDEVRTVEGKMPGERTFGLPVIEVMSIER